MNYHLEQIFESLLSINTLIKSPQIVYIMVISCCEAERIILNSPQGQFQFPIYRKVRWEFWPKLLEQK